MEKLPYLPTLRTFEKQGAFQQSCGIWGKRGTASLARRANEGDETAHRLRLACGNGLAANVWEAFQQRFRIPRILEFYAATEGGLSLFNVQGKPGAIGRIPAYLAHRFAPALVAFDFDKGEPRRDENGFVRQGFDPSQCADPLYFSHPERRAYAALDAPLYDSIFAGAIRL